MLLRDTHGQNPTTMALEDYKDHIEELYINIKLKLSDVIQHLKEVYGCETK